MSANQAVAAEAAGQEYVEVPFSGARLRVPLDVDRWPLEQIRVCRTWNLQTESLGVNHVAVIAALRRLLGVEQWLTVGAGQWRRGDLVKVSHLLAEAVGIPGKLDTDNVFGGVPRLLALLDEHADLVESDLDQFWSIDYRDRWRFDADELRRLTLRQIYVRLSNPPRLSALMRQFNDGKTPFSSAEILLMDLWEASPLVRWKKEHPSRPRTAAQKAEAEKHKVSAADQEAAKARHEARKNRQHIKNARENARAAREAEEQMT